MKKKMTKLERGEALTGYLFILPQMAGFIVLVLVPLVMVFTYSFESRNLLFGNMGFTGLDNYKTLIGDDLFYMTLKNTVIFSLGVVPLNLVLSLALALYLGSASTGTKIVRSVIFLPVITSGVAWAIVFTYLFQGGEAGPINYILSLIGIEGPNWLHEKGWAMFAVVVSRVLKNLGTNVLIFMGAVMNLPQDVLEGCHKTDSLLENKASAPDAFDSHGHDSHCNRINESVRHNQADDRWRPGRLHDGACLLYLSSGIQNIQYRLRINDCCCAFLHCSSIDNCTVGTQKEGFVL